MDASNMLKPMLARGELHLIGATTLDEYRKYIEKDAALERRFQPDIVNEPHEPGTISLPPRVRERLAGVLRGQISDAALAAAAAPPHRSLSPASLPHLT